MAHFSQFPSMLRILWMTLCLSLSHSKPFTEERCFIPGRKWRDWSLKISEVHVGIFIATDVVMTHDFPMSQYEQVSYIMSSKTF